ncbi:hypothetical protein ACFWJT_21395 [Streptomyces sp. NPDC127069]|uniref:hypothetical protein n=1 Tax=Streptomyces sp. NPDC127069 TaxID=3347128 RepID=UPI003662D832
MDRQISDEEWARFSEEVARESADAPKEPSARARMVTERLRREEEERARAGRRRFGRGPKPARNDPPGWRTGPAWQEMEGRGRVKRRLKAAAAIAVIAGLALVALRPELVIDKLTGKTDARQEARDAGPPAAETARPTGAPGAVPADRPTPKEPFRGSPAAQWADGAAGIELPEAAAVGGMPKERVAEALAMTKQLLIASNLDPATLRGERPQAALDLLDPRQEDGRPLVERGLTAPSAEANPLWLFSRFDPAQVRLVGDVVKTRGRMSFDSGRDGEVKVHADYTFVYPLVRAKSGSDEVARTVVRRTVTMALYDPLKVVTTPGKLQVVEWLESAGNDDCRRGGAGFLHPTFDSERAAAGTGPSGPVVDPYDRSGSVADMPKECATASRS